MYITLHMDLSAVVAGGGALFALDYATGAVRTHITRRKKRS